MQLKRLLLPASALLSLAFVGHFLVGLRAADANNHPIFVANQAITNRLQSAAEVAPPAAVSDIVSKALAFKAMLTTTQQATLEQAYTATLARKWSNLPCSNTCRNGIGLGALTSDQLTAALAVIQAAMNTAANEGYDEFQQIRMADDVLAAAQGSGTGGGPGGGGYGSGLYYLSFLNTPSNTGAWMMQFGGHHYAANISFNGGHIVATTPHFYGLEPLSFTVNGTTYAPLTQEHDAMANMLASLTASQLTTAKLSQTFSDAVMIPGETQGGTGTFPTTKVGIPVSGLSAAQKQLVFEAMKPWVQDMEATVAANLLSIYQSELDQTYIAYTGNGASGDASSFLNANTNYARIDGPSVWIEFVCQSGVVYRTQIHYHTVWRDHVRDYAKDLSLTTALDSSTGGTPGTVSTVTSTSAASYAAGTLAPEAIGTLFGSSLASTITSASTTPLPTTLGGVEVQVKDSNGVTRSAPLFYVSPTQVSYQLPAATSTGSATLSVMLNGTAVGQGTTTVDQVTPGLFAANANGQGVAAAIVLRVKADGSQVAENALQLNSSTNKYEAVPITAAGTGEQLFLLLFGTGFRNRTSLSTVTASVGGAAAEVTYAGAQGTFVGLDQANVRLLPALAGKGDVNITLTVDGKTSNTVTVNLK
jgi:uncharacterized protein (TIGR03437 family)